MNWNQLSVWNHVTAIAASTLTEARRNRLALLLLLSVVIAMGVGVFAASLAITETASFRSTLSASVLRIVAVTGLGLFVVSSILREFDDKLVEVTLAMPVLRVSFLLGKLAGFAGLALIVATAAGICLLLVAPPMAVLAWSVSLALELLIIASAGLLLALTLNQVTGALLVLLACYALARSLDTIRLLSENPLAGSGGWTDAATRWIIESIAFVFPALSRFTQSAWLLNAELPLATLVPVIGQGLLYVLLLGAAALFDLHRRQL